MDQQEIININLYNSMKRLMLDVSRDFHVVKSRVFFLPNFFAAATREGCRGAIIPAKMTSKPSDLQNDFQAPPNRLSASCYVSKSLPFCLHAPHFDLRNYFFNFLFTFYGLTNQKFKVIFSLHGRLRNSLKNNLIDKFEILQ